MNPNNHITYIKICCHENQVNSPNLKMWVEEQTNKKKKNNEDLTYTQLTKNYISILNVREKT